MIPYQGSKRLSAKKIAEIINETIINNNIENFYDLFAGSLSVSLALRKINKNVKIHCNDSNKSLIMLYKEVQNKTYKLPKTPTKSEFYEYKKMDECADKLFIGIGSTFSNMYYGSYTDKKANNIYFEKLYNKLYKNDISDFNFLCMDYKDVPINENSLIYCDPPYLVSYCKYYERDFNTVEFWDFCDDMDELGHSVYISEIKAPRRYKMIYEQFIKNPKMCKKEFNKEQGRPDRLYKL